MGSSSSRGVSRVGWAALVASLPIAALVWSAATHHSERHRATEGVGSVEPPAAERDDTSETRALFPAERCLLRTALGPVTCEFGNRDDPGSDMTFGTAYARFRWRTAGGQWATNYLE